MTDSHNEEMQAQRSDHDAGEIVMNLGTKLMEIDKHAQNTFKDDPVAREVYRRNESYKAILECGNAGAVFDGFIALGTLRSVLALTGRITAIKYNSDTGEFDVGYVLRESGQVCHSAHRDLVAGLIEVLYAQAVQHMQHPLPRDRQSMVHYLLSAINDADVVALETAVQPAITLMERPGQPNPVRTLLDMLKTTRIKHKECVQLLTKPADEEKT